MFQTSCAKHLLFLSALLLGACSDSGQTTSPVPASAAPQVAAPVVAPAAPSAVPAPQDVTGYYLYKDNPGALLVRKDPSGKFFEFEIYTRDSSNGKECNVVASEAADSTRIIDTVPVAGMNDESVRIFNVSFTNKTAKIDQLEADTESCAMAAFYGGDYVLVSTPEEKAEAVKLLSP
jgi:hypothetical protein